MRNVEIDPGVFLLFWCNKKAKTKTKTTSVFLGACLKDFGLVFAFILASTGKKPEKHARTQKKWWTTLCACKSEREKTKKQTHEIHRRKKGKRRKAFFRKNNFLTLGNIKSKTHLNICLH